MTECQNNLSGAEVKRNVHGPMYCYEFSTTNSGVLEAQYGLSSVNKLYCKESPIYRDEVSERSVIESRNTLTNFNFIQKLDVAEKDLVLGPSKGALSDVYFPGFPTMKHLKYTVRSYLKVGFQFLIQFKILQGSLKFARTRVFDQPR